MDKKDTGPKPIFFPVGKEVVAGVSDTTNADSGGDNDELWPKEDMPDNTESGEYGGIGRLWFFLIGAFGPVLLLLPLQMLGVVDLRDARSGGAAEVAVNAVWVVLGMCLIYQRYRNIGANAVLWTFLTLVPIFNIYCALLLYCAPEGYWDGKKFDKTGKILAGIYFLFFGLLALLLHSF